MKNLIVLICLVSFNLSVFANQPSIRSVKLKAAKAAALNKAPTTAGFQATRAKRNLLSYD